MRNTFAEDLYNLTLIDEKIYCIVADISPAGAMDKIRSNYPNRLINVGVSEQSMVGIAAGMAMEGFKPFIYTIATFSLYRPFEMIRNDLCYQNLPVTIVGMGAGLVYSSLGGTHHAFEDIAIAGAIPNMQILAPCDPLELSESIKYCAIQNKGPIYLRIGKSGEKNITNKAIEPFIFGKIRKIKEGKKICILTYGTISSLSFDVIDKNFDGKISLYVCHTLKPFDIDGVKSLFNRYSVIITIEEHVPVGGLSCKVKELGFDNKYGGLIKSITLKDEFIHFHGDYTGLLEMHGISSNILNDILFKELAL